MLYNQLEGLLQPYFLSRGSDSLAGIDMIETYINMAIQDIYNEDNWVFKIKEETISTYVDENGRRRFTSTYDIDMFTEAKDQDGNDIYPMTTSLRDDKRKFNVNGKNIYFILNTDVTSIYITYTRQYKWYNRVTNGGDVIPLPDKFIPAVVKAIYDYTAPINLFDGEQTQVDFFGHYTNRINKLKNLDGLSESTSFIPYNNYYV